MKQVYKVISSTEYVGPFETVDDFPVEVPYTDKPIPEDFLQPSFDFGQNEWVDLTPQILKDELNAQKEAQEKLGKTAVQLSLGQMKMQKQINDLTKAGE
ncbi:hypothetical protein IGI37_000111 [Enterococcus sp. AZ194]|uniref:hypothetical protein n=1 Tax=Enterococcus sp. AZ194 TaxID=2774629 RepID=UPI003F23CC39